MRRLVIAGLVAVTLGTAGALLTGPSAQGGSSATFNLIFDDARGLVAGQLVKVAGAQAGTIQNVTVTRDFKARIQATVDSRFLPFHRDATCAIRPQGLIGENYVECDPGTANSPPLPTIAGHPPTVPVANTTEPVSLLDLFNIFNAPARERLTVFLNELGIATSARGQDINEILRRANPALSLARQVIGILLRQRAQLSTIVQATDRLTASGAADTADVQNFLARTAAFTALTADHRTSLALGINRLPAMLAATQPALDQLDGVARNSTPLVRQLDAAAPSLNRITDDLGPFVKVARPGLAKLGSAVTRSLPALRDSVPLFTLLRIYLDRSKGGTLLAGRLFSNLQRHGFVENFLSLFYYIDASLARFDSTSHLLSIRLMSPGNGLWRNLRQHSCGGVQRSLRQPAGVHAQRRLGGPGRHAVELRPIGSQPAPGSLRTPGPGQLPAQMRSLRSSARAAFDNPILIGTVTILVVVLAVYLSYIAENGLPFVPTYAVNVEVANAGQLIKNADVRIGGARVGQVLTITPEPANRAWPHPYARLGLSLQRSLEPLPPDSHYQVRVASALGGNYVEIVPGQERHGGVRDGGTLALDTNPRLNHNLAYVDLDTALATFGPRTRSGLRGVLAGLGDTLAGRGAQLNDAIVSIRGLLGPLDRLLTTLAAPSTRLAGFLRGLSATTGALAPVAPAINAVLASAATTLGALTRRSWGSTLDRLPGTETVATNVLRRAQPVLAEAAGVARALRPSAAVLPLAASRLDALVTAATPVFRRVPRLASGLLSADRALVQLVHDPAAAQALGVIGSNDLGTLGSSAFIGLGAILKSVAPAQFHCNVAGLWVRNFASALSEGNGSGSWLRFSPILDLADAFQASTPASDLHLNYYPVENSGQCQAGNEVYTGGQLIGNPSQTTTRVDNTAAPPGVLARGEKAGLVP